MDSERYRQLDDLLQLVLERPPEERAAYLRQVCAGDEALERELRTLVAIAHEAGSFLESPAVEVAARALAGLDSKAVQPARDPPIGSTVSHYRITAKLGWRREGCGL